MLQVHGIFCDQELDRVETFSDGELFALWQEQFRGRYGAQYLRDEELDVISSAMNQPMSIHVETNTDRILTNAKLFSDNGCYNQRVFTLYAYYQSYKSWQHGS